MSGINGIGAAYFSFLFERLRISLLGASKRRRSYCLSRYDWRRGPTPKRDSRRWRAREVYRMTIQGNP